MTDHRLKRDFVANELKSLLVGMDIYIKDCEYMVKNDLEIVKVIYATNGYEMINVTGDSLKVLTLDVIKGI